MSQSKNISNIRIVIAIIFFIAYNLTISKMIELSQFDYSLNSNPSFFVFGVLQGMLISIAIVILGFYLRLNKDNVIPFVILICGVLSNLIEMILNQYVVDYIDIIIAKLNLADIQIYISLAVILILQLTKNKTIITN
jgi:lipoprotein signal peptidase